MNTEWPGYTKVFIVNLAIVALGCSCAMFYDKVKNCFQGTKISIIFRSVTLSVTLEASVQ